MQLEILTQPVDISHGAEGLDRSLLGHVGAGTAGQVLLPDPGRPGPAPGRNRDLATAVGCGRPDSGSPGVAHDELALLAAPAFPGSRRGTRLPSRDADSGAGGLRHGPRGVPQGGGAPMLCPSLVAPA